VAIPNFAGGSWKWDSATAQKSKSSAALRSETPSNSVYAASIYLCGANKLVT
jgi:hypothetical protein